MYMYMRFSVNGERLYVHGGPSTEIRSKFHRIKGDVVLMRIMHSQMPSTRRRLLNQLKSGDTVTIELLKRTKTKPRLPVATIECEVVFCQQDQKTTIVHVSY
jgi:hypothetical protein